MLLSLRFIAVILCFVSLKLLALGIAPTKVFLSVKEPIATLTVSNERDEPLLIQMAVFKWRQVKGEESYTATNNVIAMPQIFTLAPHAQQLIRVALDGQQFKNYQQGYRLIIEEVITHTRLNKKKQTLNFALRLSLPIIVESTTATQNKLIWYSKILSSHQIKLTAVNKGNNVVHISSLQPYVTKNNPIAKQHSVFVYLLPGSQKEWTLPVNKNFHFVQATVNNRKIFSDVD